MRITFISLALVAGTALASPAFAQDSAPDEQPFSGFYVGGSIGYTAQPSNARESLVFDTNLDGTFGDTVNTSAGANAFSPGFCNGRAQGTTPAAGCDTSRDDIEYFGRVGFDIQRGNVVFGLVGEFGRSNATSSVSGFSTTPASYTITREMDYNANLRARIGYTPGRTTLFYATGGGAYAKLDNTFTTSNTANSFTSTSSGSDAWGWTAGGGVEQMIGRNFSVGLEYLHTRLGDDDYSVRVGPGTAPATNPFLLVNANGTDLRRSSDDFTLHQLRLTANFRF